MREQVNSAAGSASRTAGAVRVRKPGGLAPATELGAAAEYAPGAGDEVTLERAGTSGELVPAGALAPDVLLIAYLLVTGVLALAAGARTGLELGLVHALAGGLMAFLSRRPLPRFAVLRFFRIGLPLLAMPFLYIELRVLDQLLFHGYFDATVQGWEHALFGVQLSVAAARALPYTWLSEILHLGYFSYYLVVPVAAVAAYLEGGPKALERLTLTVGLAFVVCYLCFIVFPVAGPRYMFPPLSGPPARAAVYELVHHVLESGSSKGTAFPSSHVAVAVSALLAAWRDGRRGFWILLLPVSALVVGTVYGRFHYGVDALAGLCVAAIAYVVAPWLLARLGGTVAATRSR